MRKVIYARKQWRKYFLVGVVIVSLLYIIAYGIGVVLDLSQSIFFGLGMAAGALLMGFLLNHFVPLVDKSKNYRVGAEGEELVIENLENNLNGVNLVISDLVLGDNQGNIDHVVIGDHGIFVVETKNLHGEFIVDGDKWIRKTSMGTIVMKKSPSKQVKSNGLKLNRLIEKKFAKLKNVYIYNVVVLSDSTVKINTLEKPKYCNVIKSTRTLGEFINTKQIFLKNKQKNKSTSKLQLNKDDYRLLKKIFLPYASRVILSENINPK